MLYGAQELQTRPVALIYGFYSLISSRGRSAWTFNIAARSKSHHQALLCPACERVGRSVGNRRMIVIDRRRRVVMLPRHWPRIYGFDAGRKDQTSHRAVPDLYDRRPTEIDSRPELMRCIAASCKLKLSALRDVYSCVITQSLPPSLQLRDRRDRPPGCRHVSTTNIHRTYKLACWAESSPRDQHIRYTLRCACTHNNWSRNHEQFFWGCCVPKWKCDNISKDRRVGGSWDIHVHSRQTNKQTSDGNKTKQDRDQIMLVWVRSCNKTTTLRKTVS